MRARRMSSTLWVTKAGLRGSAIRSASFVAIPNCRSIVPSSRTPPSALMRPPSKAAVSFLPPTAGKPKGRIVSLDMAGGGPRGGGGGGGVSPQPFKPPPPLFKTPPKNPPPPPKKEGWGGAGGGGGARHKG